MSTPPILTTIQAATSFRVAIQMSLDNKTMPPAGSPALTADELQALTAWDDGTVAPGVPAMLELSAPTAPVYFTGTIANVLNTSCTGCHFHGGTLPDLSAYLSTAKVGAILMTTLKSGTMPPPSSKKPPLDAPTMAEFQSWIDAGMPLDSESGPAPTAPPPTPEELGCTIG